MAKAKKTTLKVDPAEAKARGPATVIILLIMGLLILLSSSAIAPFISPML
jgi:hypothetical protein